MSLRSEPLWHVAVRPPLILTLVFAVGGGVFCGVSVFYFSEWAVMAAGGGITGAILCTIGVRTLLRGRPPLLVVEVTQTEFIWTLWNKPTAVDLSAVTNIRLIQNDGVRHFEFLSKGGGRQRVREESMLRKAQVVELCDVLEQVTGLEVERKSGGLRVLG
ncbi:MAG: hypothetical protein HRU16_11475 [Planctomycetes bacterium]|nr:hypothetical protein [Planctomycetota bacterium]